MSINAVDIVMRAKTRQNIGFDDLARVAITAMHISHSARGTRALRCEVREKLEAYNETLSSRN